MALPYDPHVFLQTETDIQAGCNPFMMIMAVQPNTSQTARVSNNSDSNLLSAESVTELTNEFEAVDAVLQTAKTQYANLIDSGNSNGLLSNIHSRWNRDTTALRINLLAQSPNLSTTALLATAQLGVLKKQALMQILLANPSACRASKFLRSLQRDMPNLLTDAEMQQLRKLVGQIGFAPCII